MSSSSSSSSSSRPTMREVRLSTATSMLASARTRASLAPSSLSSAPPSKAKAANTSSKAAFTSAPKKVLNLSNVKSRDWASRADGIISKVRQERQKEENKKKESRRSRKRREWMEMKARWAREEEGKATSRKGHHSGEEEGWLWNRRGEQQSPWAFLPDLVLEQVFQLLPFQSKHNAALVCRQWGRALRFRTVWSDYVVNDHSMTQTRFNFAGKFYENRFYAALTCRSWSRVLYMRSTWNNLVITDEVLREAGMCRYKFNYYATSDEEVLDSVKASNALHRIAPRLKRISFIPKKNLHTICSFQRMITKYCEFYGSLPNNEVDIYGTGGMILEDMKGLLVHLPGLKRLELIDLELDGIDASHVLDEVSEVCNLKITELNLVNTSRRPCSLLAVASFVNLRCLTISPHNLGDDLVECLGDMPRLRNVTIMTNSYTECVATPVDYRVWKQARKTNPRLRVHLVTEGKHSKEVTFQSRAPVKSIVYDTPYTRASAFSINLVVELYRTDLECYAHKGLPRFHMPKAFHERPDSSLLYLVRQCPYLHTLMIRQRISSSTILLLAYAGKNLRYFHVRRNAVILRCEWPKNPEWSLEFYKWLRKNSRTYEDMEREVSQILGFRWYALNDKQFKLTPLNINIPYYYEGFEEA